MSDREYWPADADGDVLRNLKRGGFDFERCHTVEFNVDFSDWPPPIQAVERIRDKYPNAKVCKPEYANPGYVLVSICMKLSYRGVVETQSEISKMVAQFEGYCDSWGVLNA